MKRRRARREVAPKMSVPGQIVPDKCLVTMPYFLSDSVNMNGATSSARVFRSAAFDPEYATGGHQPLGYDQWALFYQNCRVFGVTGTVKFLNESSGQRYYVGLLYTDDVSAVPATGSTAMWEQQTVRPKLIGAPDGGHDVATLKVSWKPAQTLGMTKEQYRTSDGTFGTMSSASGTVPTIVSFMLGLIWTVDGAPATLNDFVTVMYDLKFHCECFGRRPLASS